MKKINRFRRQILSGFYAGAAILLFIDFIESRVFTAKVEAPAALVLLFLILIVFPFVYTNMNFYVCPVEKTNSNNASVCDTRTLTFGEGVRQSLVTAATLQTVEMRKPNSPASETFTILEKIFAPLQAALLA